VENISSKHAKFNTMCPPDINQNKRKQCKGHNQQFQIPHARTGTFKDSFIQKTLKDWNQLDPNILQKSTSAKDPSSTFAELIRQLFPTEFVHYRCH
jgi:homoserine trans-succinylase